MPTKIDKTLARMSILLTCGKSIGRTALNKLLFFSDISAYLLKGTKISNSDYVKLDYGPVPDGMRDVHIYLTEELGLMQVTLEFVGPYIQHTYRTVELEGSDIKSVENNFDEENVAILRRVREHFGPMTASRLSHISHQYEPWKSAQYGGKLDFSLADNDPSLRRMLQEAGIPLP